MRQGPNNKRMRGRGNGRKGGHSRNQSFESNGPEVKVRGNAQQVVEKYLTLARDASSAGDRINSESYYQFADHYYRVMNANAANEQQRQLQNSTPDSDNEIRQNGSISEGEDTSTLPEGAGVDNNANGRSRRRSSRSNKRDQETTREDITGQSQNDPASGEDSKTQEASDPASA